MQDQLPIYCISVPSTGRRLRMERRLAHHDLLGSTRFVEAEAWPSGSTTEETKRLRGQACFAGHVRALHAMLETEADVPGAIVCEDDVLLHDDWHARLDAVLANLPAGAPLCALGYLVFGWHSGFAWAGRNPKRHNLRRIVPNELLGTQMYWISRRYAEDVLARYGGLPSLPSQTEPIVRESDGYLSYPPLALEDAIDSTIRPPDELQHHLEALRIWPYRDYAAGEQGDHRSPLASFARPNVALCMIVKDEAPVIGRCIASALPLLDTWVICDTGSTDTTPDLIHDAVGRLPGQLHHRPWRDFAHNRTELLRLARGSADYLLLLDADQTLRIGSALPELTADAYFLRQTYGALDYATPHLIRSNREWWYESPAHEYLATNGDYSRETLAELMVEHHGDGSSSGRRLAWDAEVLERELQRDPASARATFYLAQTHRDLGNEQRAIELYRARVELGGWDEEVFYAAYQAGALLAKTDPDAAVPALLDAWERRPTRAEPLHELARICRSQGRYQAAYAFAARGADLPFPTDLLFVHRAIYEWALPVELSVAAYWTGRVEEALAVTERLLVDDRLPASVRRIVEGNRRLCLRRLGRRGRSVNGDLPALGDLAPSLALGEIRLDVSPSWPQFNPTIAKDGSGFRVIVRTANYRLESGVYHYLTDERGIQSLNYLVALDERLGVSHVDPLAVHDRGPQRYPSRVRGYEDCRLVELNEQWLALATVRDRNPDERAELLLLKLDGASVVDEVLLVGPDPARHEKNWMPFVVGDELRVVYTSGPTVVLACDTATGRTEAVSRFAAPSWATALRGGSQGVPVDGGFLFVVHEVADSGGRRTYLHRFVLLDEELRLAAASRRFHFVTVGVEFCGGLARDGTRLVLGFGAADRAAGLAVVDLDEVTGLLEQVA